MSNPFTLVKLRSLNSFLTGITVLFHNISTPNIINVTIFLIFLFILIPHDYLFLFLISISGNLNIVSLTKFFPSLDVNGTKYGTPKDSIVHK
ncbi:hypothetical protein D3C73_973530 [compost metagenome]